MGLLFPSSHSKVNLNQNAPFAEDHYKHLRELKLASEQRLKSYFPFNLFLWHNKECYDRVNVTYNFTFSPQFKL